MTRQFHGGFVALLVALAGCGDALGPIDSQSISLTINSMNASDIDPPGTIEKDKNISTETGNPWGALLVSAESTCGADPVGFEVLSASITLDVAGSSDVTTFEDVISDEASVHFLSTQGSDASATRVVIASSVSVTGTGPVELVVTATRSQLQTLIERLIGGDFHVGLSADTDRLDSDSFSMDVIVTFQVRAHCD